MRRSLRSWLGLALSAILVAGGIVASPPTASAAPFTVLVFSKTAGFRHDSIPAGITAIQQLGAPNDFTVEATEDAAQFTDANLAGSTRSIWLSTTGDVLNAAQQAAFERYITRRRRLRRRARRLRHRVRLAVVRRAGRGLLRQPPRRAERHASRSPTRCTRPPRAAGSGGTASTSCTTTAPTPAATRTCWPPWTRPPTPAAAWAPTTRSPGARTTPAAEPGTPAWGTPTRRTPRPNFRTHLLGGIRTAAGAVDADCGPTVTSSFQQVELAKGAAETGEPMSLTVLPDRGVLHTSRNGVIRHTDVAGNTKIAADPAGLHRRRGGSAGHQGRPELRHQPLGVRLLRPTAEHPGRRRAGHRHAGAVRPSGTASTGWPGSPSTRTTPSTRPARRLILERADQPGHVLPRRR